MARTKVMKLWTTIVTAFLALCTALGLVTTTAAAAVPQSETARNSARPPQTAPATSPESVPHTGLLPPTMKQRIRAEAHGSSPSCRQRPVAATSTRAITQAALRCPDGNGSETDTVISFAPLQH